MATIKAGTYTMKEVLSLPSDYITINSPTTIEIGSLSFGNTGSISIGTDTIWAYAISEIVDVYVNGAWKDEEYAVWTFTSDFSATDEFSTWFNSNLKPPEAKFVRLIREDEVSAYDGSYTITENGTVPCANKMMTQDLTVNVAGSGESTSSGLELNIAYGTSAPADKTKLWVYGDTPSKVVAENVIRETPTVTALSETLPNRSTHITNTAVVGTKIYYKTPSYVGTLSCFDTETKTVSVLTTMFSGSIQDSTAAAVGTDIYFFGGSAGQSNYSSKIWKYDTLSNTGEELSVTLPTEMYGFQAGVVGNKVYLFGGVPITTDILCFDASTQTITTIAEKFPYRARRIGVAVCGTDIYLFGGYDADRVNGTSFLDTIYRFNTSNETIEAVSTSLVQGCDDIGVATVGNKIYLFGGDQSDNIISCFDVDKQKLVEIGELPTSIYTNEVTMLCAQAVGDEVYLIGGYTGSYLSTIAVATFAFDLAQNEAYIHLSKNKNYFNIVNAENAVVEAGVEGVYRGSTSGIAGSVTAYLYGEELWNLVSGEYTLVDFKINSYPSRTWQAEEGMTWEQWIDSGYNTGTGSGKFYIDGTSVMISERYYLTYSSGSYVKASDVITAQTYTYYYESIGGGADD